MVINTYFYSKKEPKKDCIYLAAIVIDSVCKIKKMKINISHRFFFLRVSICRKNTKKKNRHIKGTRLIPDSNEDDESDDDESIK